MRYFCSLIMLLGHSIDGVAITDEAWRMQAEAIVEQVKQRSGTLKVPAIDAVIDIPPRFVYLDRIDAERVLVDIWGNPPETGALALVIPAETDLLDPDSWGVVVQYLNDGYIELDRFVELDFEAMAESMAKASRKAAVERLHEGYAAPAFEGWARSPTLSLPAESHGAPILTWAKRFEALSDGSVTINDHARVLGARGAVVLNAVTDEDQSGKAARAIGALARSTDYGSGSSYSDFDPIEGRSAPYDAEGLITEVTEAQGRIPMTTALSLALGTGVLLLAGALALIIKRQRRR